jgi:hypothetical protein
MPANVEVTVHGRWDALALSQHFDAYLVERGREHWRMRTEAPDCHGEPEGAGNPMASRPRVTRTTGLPQSSNVHLVLPFVLPT